MKPKSGVRKNMIFLQPQTSYFLHFMIHNMEAVGDNIQFWKN